MNRSLGSIAAAVALLLTVGSGLALSSTACSSSGGSGNDTGGTSDDGGPGSGADGGAGDGGSHPRPGADGSTDDDGGADASFDAGPPAVVFLGRFDTTSAAGPKVAWPGARITANFKGTEVKATFVDTALFSPEYGGDRWQVSIDGAITKTIQLDHTQPSTTYTLATGLTDAAHSVEIVKLTEGSVGTTQFEGFDYSGGTLLPPSAPAKRHLQVLGDSSSNGYGIEGTDPCDFTGATQNETLAYPALMAKALSADHHTLGASGKGVFRDYAGPSDPDTFPVIYQLDGVASGGATPWAYADYTPDVVWITLGGNDYDDSPSAKMKPPRLSDFQNAYDNLVTTIRSQYPAAHIFCSVAPSLSDAFPAGFNAYTSVKTALQNVVAAHAADGKIYYFEFTRSTSADLTACGGHPNAAKHQAMAVEASNAVKAKTGW